VEKITPKRIILIGVVTITLVNLKHKVKSGGAVEKRILRQEAANFRSTSTTKKKKS
jgi:hypothetical protein